MSEFIGLIEKQVVEKLDIPTYFNDHLVGTKKGVTPINDYNAGSICPFHDENESSFRYTAVKRIFKCFGCGVAGDIIALHRLTEKRFHNRVISKYDACVELNNLYNLGIDCTISEEERHKSVFESCRAKITPKPASAGLCLSVLVHQNNRAIRDASNVEMQDLIDMYTMVDSMAALYYARGVQH